MGTWSTGAFGNDMALDWVQDLQESSDLYYIEDTLNNALSPDSAQGLEAPFAVEALAAIDVLARLQGQPGEPEETVDAWVDVARAKFKRRPDLVQKSLQALDLVLAEPSELRQLWEDSEHYDAWRAGVEALKGRIDA